MCACRGRGWRTVRIYVQGAGGGVICVRTMVYVAEEVIAIDLRWKKAVVGGISSPRITGAIQLACKLPDSYLQDQASIGRKSWLWETGVKPSIST